MNNAGEIEVSGGNSISLAKGGYEVSLSLLVNDRSGTTDARTTFMAAIYDSSGNELQKIEPLVGYNRNISTNMTRMDHIGKFLVNMASAGEISVRAKVYQVGDNANPAQTTQSGAVVRIFKLGGPKGEKGDTGGLDANAVNALIAAYGNPFSDAAMARLLPTPPTGATKQKLTAASGAPMWEDDTGDVRKGYMPEPDVLFNSSQNISSGFTVPITNWRSYKFLHFETGNYHTFLSVADIPDPISPDFYRIVADKLEGNNLASVSIRASGTDANNIRIVSGGTGTSPLTQILGWK